MTSVYHILYIWYIKPKPSRAWRCKRNTLGHGWNIFLVLKSKMEESSGASVIMTIIAWKCNKYLLYTFYTPVFRRDVLWYGDVRPSVRPSVRPGLRPSVRPSVTVFRTFLLHALTYWSEILCITLILCM